MRALRALTLTLTVLVVIALAFGAGFGLGSHQPFVPALPGEFRLVGEVWNVLSRDFVDQAALNPQELSRGAIEGILATLGDPYTSYIDPEHYELAEASFRGSFEGIGAEVSLEDGQLTVVAPMAGSPAERAGLRAGDKILAVDGQPTSQMTLAGAVAKIRGPGGTKVTLSILHPGDEAPVDIEVTREEIKTPSVSFQALSQGIAHIRLTQFGERTNTELETVLREVRAEGLTGIILDLRGNSGGFLGVTVEVASQFLKEGVVLYELDSQGARREWSVRPGGLATDLPLAVLVDRGTASGAEVLAGAIQDAGRGPLIGIRTFGKGSVNQIHQLSDGSALYVTTARWLTPKGNQIEGMGLTPDIEVPLTEEDRALGLDPQLDRAVEYLQVGR